MQTKIYNAYKITHKNGSVEDINALDLVQALENMEIPDTESKVLQAFLVKENVRTLVEDEKTEILFSAIVAENGGGSIATPASGKIHVGDMIQLKAIPARNYEFVSWKLNDVKISEEHDDFGWFTYEEIDVMIKEELLTPPAIIAFSKN